MWITVTFTLAALLAALAARPAWADSAPPSLPPAVQETLEVLREVHEDYGPDAVTLLTWLLDATVKHGSILTASIKVQGLERYGDKAYLSFRVETGFILNSRAMDGSARLGTLWQRIVAPALTRLDKLDIPADGVVIDLLYNHKPYDGEDELRKTLDDPGRPEQAKFYLAAALLRAYLTGALTTQALLDRSTVTLDGRPVAPSLPPGSAGESRS